MKSMMTISSIWNEKESFKLIPINNDCPYVEAIFDADSKTLIVLSKVIKQSFHMLPKLDDNGDVVIRKNKQQGAPPIKQERKIIETFQEYYLTDSKDIRYFVERFSENSFDITKYTTSLVIADTDAAKSLKIVKTD